MVIAILCQASPVFTFANKAGLDLLETHFGALQNITLEKVLDEAGHANLFAVFSTIMQLVTSDCIIHSYISLEYNCMYNSNSW